MHVRGVGPPDEAAIELWVDNDHGGRISREPVANADTVFDGGWILPGLVDAHCHVGLGDHGEIALDEAIAQAEAEREVGALLLRDCGSPTDTRSLDDHEDLPRIIRAGKHLARPKGYQAGFSVELEDESQLPAVVAEQARRGDGWIKLVGDWIDRSVGDLAPLWSDDVLKAAIDTAHAHGARVTAHVFSEDALPWSYQPPAIDCIEHGTGLTDDTIELMVEHVLGLGADAWSTSSRTSPASPPRPPSRYPVLRRPHARPAYARRPAPARRGTARRACRSTPAATPAPWSPPDGSPTRSRRSGYWDEPDCGTGRGMLGCPQLAGQTGSRGRRVRGSAGFPTGSARRGAHPRQPRPRDPAWKGLLNPRSRPRSSSVERALGV